MRKPLPPLFLTALLAVLLLLPLRAAELTRDNLRYVDYPDFPEAHSTWGSIGYSSKFDRGLHRSDQPP